MSVYEGVLLFHQTFGSAIRTLPIADVPEKQLRIDLINEEAKEYEEAALDNDIVKMADALADIVYVCYGAAITHGIDLDAVIQEVQRSNMSKLGRDGKPIYREDGKVLKGPNYTKPDVKGVLFNE